MAAVSSVGEPLRVSMRTLEMEPSRWMSKVMLTLLPSELRGIDFLVYQFCAMTRLTA